jgi:hypothetical protein
LSTSPSSRPGRLLEWLGAIASVATIFGAFVWWSGQQERDEDSSARRVDLISKARQILLDESSDGTFEYGSDKLNDWAIRTLAQYGIPIQINAAEVNLVFADLECASLEIHADKVSIQNAFVRKSFLDVDANEVDIDTSHFSTVFVSSAYQARKANVIRIQSSLLDDVTIGMWLNLAATAISEKPFRELRHEVELVGSMARSFKIETSKGVLDFEAMTADATPLLVSPSICQQQDRQGSVLKCAPVNLLVRDIRDQWAKRLSTWEWSYLYEKVSEAPCPQAQRIPNTRRIP